MEQLQRELAQALKDLRNSVDRLPQRSTDSSSVSKVEINAGGVGIWIAATCCVAMLTSLIVGSLFLTSILGEQSRSIADLNSYLQAIYVQAPQLKPKDSK